MFGTESPEISQASYLLGYRVMSYLSLVLASMTLFFHFILVRVRIPIRFGFAMYAALGLLPWLLVFGRLTGRTSIPLEDFVILVLSFGITSYVIVAEVFLRWGAEQLNRFRSTWVRELEYVYVLFGMSGLVVSINRIEAMDGRFAALDFIGPLIVMLAVVIKLVKIRAEVSRWDNPEVLRRWFEAS